MKEELGRTNASLMKKDQEVNAMAEHIRWLETLQDESLR